MMKKRTIAGAVVLLLAGMMVTPTVAYAAPSKLTTENLMNAYSPKVCHDTGHFKDGHLGDYPWESAITKVAIGRLGGQTVGVVGVDCFYSAGNMSPSLIIYNSNLKPIHVIRAEEVRAHTVGQIAGLKLSSGVLTEQISQVLQKGDDKLNSGTANLALRITRTGKDWNVKQHYYNEVPTAQTIAHAIASSNTAVMRRYLPTEAVDSMVQDGKIGKQYGESKRPSTLKCVAADPNKYSPPYGSGIDLYLSDTRICVMGGVAKNGQTFPAISIWATYHGYRDYSWWASVVQRD